MPHLAYYWTRFPQGPVRHIWCRALLYSEAPSGIPLDKFSLGPCPAYMWGTFILKGPIWHTIRQVFLRALSGICICRPLLYSQGLSGIILDEFYLGPCLAYTYAGHIYTEAPSGILLDKLSLGSCPLYMPGTWVLCGPVQHYWYVRETPRAPGQTSLKIASTQCINVVIPTKL